MALILETSMFSSPEHADPQLELETNSWVCILHFSLKIPNSSYTFRGGCASHHDLFTVGKAALGSERGCGGARWDGSQAV